MEGKKDNMNKDEICFAKSKDGTICYALTEMKCDNCSFYKPKSQVPGYSKYIPINKKKKIKEEKDKINE